MIEFRWKPLTDWETGRGLPYVLQDSTVKLNRYGVRIPVQLQYREWPRDMSKHMTPKWKTVEISDD